MFIDFQTLQPTEAYFTMTHTLIPRPIAWVLSDNGNSSYNLAPFSYFNAVCSDPPLTMISIGQQPDGAKKDTVVNISEREHFVIHIASVDQLPALNQTAMTLPHGESELDHTNIELTTSANFELPFIEECPVAYFCERYQIQEIGNNHQSLVFGQIKNIYINDNVATEDDKGRFKLDIEKSNPLARLGASEYASLGQVHSIKRPK